MAGNFPGAIQDGAVGIDAAIAKERPVAASVFALRGIAFDDEDFFLVVGSFSDDLAEGIGDEGAAPEFEARIAVGRFAFEADTADDGDVHAVGDGMRALDSFPGVELCRAEFRFFVGMPADAGGIENYLRAAEGGDARAFGIPLVPADLHADSTVLRLEVGESEIAGGEIKFFVVQRVVGDVHFSIFAEEAAVRIEHRAGIVVNAGSAAFEEGNDQDDFLFFRHFGECVGCRTGNGLSEIEELGIFLAAEIFGTKKFM